MFRVHNVLNSEKMDIQKEATKKFPITSAMYIKHFAV